MTKNDFQQYINAYIWSRLQKKSHFSKQSVNCQFNLCLVLHAGPMFRFHESNGGIKIDKRASVENYIFQGKLFRFDLHKTLIT